MNIASQLIEQRRQEFQTNLQNAKENAQSGSFEEELDASTTTAIDTVVVDDTTTAETTTSSGIALTYMEDQYNKLINNQIIPISVDTVEEVSSVSASSNIVSSGSDKWNIEGRYNIPNVSSENENKYIDIITEMSNKYGVPVDLIQIMIQTESNYNNSAGSSSGAQGLMQLMPSTASGLSVTDPYDPRQNIEAGTKLISGQLDKYNGDLVLALAAYNAGSGNVNKYGGVPPFDETINYIDKITGIDVSDGYSL